MKTKSSGVIAPTESQGPATGVAAVTAGSTTFPREREVAEKHEMRAQMSSDFGDRETAAEEMETAHAIRRLVKLLDEANGLLRSAHEVAKRDGADTHWQPFRDRLMEALQRQHRVMYPSNNADEGRAKS